MVYILEFEQPVGNYRHAARYYIGWCKDDRLEARLWHHRRGTGARLTAAAAERGIGFTVIVTWPGETRNFERQLKLKKNTPRLVRALRKRGVIQ
jgi:putative endonuclease